MREDTRNNARHRCGDKQLYDKTIPNDISYGVNEFNNTMTHPYYKVMGACNSIFDETTQ